MKHYTVILIFLLGMICLANGQAHKGKLIFSIKVIEKDNPSLVIDELGNKKPYNPKVKDGIYFFVETHNTPENITIKTIAGYKYLHDKMEGFSSLGSTRTAKFLHELDQIGFKLFNFDKLIRADNKQKRTTLAPGGSKRQLVINHDGNKFIYEAWNMRGFIEIYSKKNSEVAKLKRVVDHFSLMYGNGQLGL